MMKQIKVLATPRFEKSLKRLAKHFPKITKEVAELVLKLESAELIGDLVPNVNYTVYKARLANPDAQKGKSGGFRLIYYLKTNEKIFFINIYSKTEQTDMPASVFAEWIKDYESTIAEDSNTPENE